jgi:hypothetical protein
MKDHSLTRSLFLCSPVSVPFSFPAAAAAAAASSTGHA